MLAHTGQHARLSCMYTPILAWLWYVAYGNYTELALYKGKGSVQRQGECTKARGVYKGKGSSPSPIFLIVTELFNRYFSP